MKQLIYNIIIFIFCISLFTNCKKYLDAKPNINLQVASTLADGQALLDFTNDMNLNSPIALETPADDCVLLDVTWNGFSEITNRNLYIWEKDVFNETYVPGDWVLTYVPVYRANVVLETVEKIERTVKNAKEWDQVKGAALLFRARGFYDALQIWAKGYDKQTSSSDLGIPLRLHTNFNELSKRSTVLECYQQILSDLKQAANLLDVRIQHPHRPSKAAAYGWLARTYLAMQEYDKAGENADMALKIKGNLMDYNRLNLTATFPFLPNNEEVIFSTVIVQQSSLSNGRINSELYAEYIDSDLRKQAYFKNFPANGGGGIGFKGSYFGDNSGFTGISTNEMYLVRAECYARANKNEEALTDLNNLLVKRYATGKYSPYTTANTSDALSLVLKERRKELLFRGLRWTDLKRLNKEPSRAVTVKRVLNGVEYVLPPNDKRYAFSIPTNVIEITGMPQN